MNRIVIDTNCLLASVSRRGNYYAIWRAFQKGRFTLCVTNEILQEYHEICTRKMPLHIANRIIEVILQSPNTKFITPYYRFNMIQADADDNKFIDCAIAAQARFVVTNDTHFDVLQQIPFPHVDIIHIDDFLRLLLP